MAVPLFKSLAKAILPQYQTLHLEYPVRFRPRYGHGRPPHGALYSIIDKHRDAYAALLQEALGYREMLSRIPDASRSTDDAVPCWNNGFLPGLDIVMLYAMMATGKALRYVEIGSGNSTKVAHYAKRNHALDCRIVSIDPAPRAGIDALADEVLRIPFEDNDQAWVKSLQPGDIVFVDNSHRVFPNSDAMVFFMEVLPALPPGVLVQVHDVYLPFDYPQDMCDRFYSEQYMLAAFFLANPEKYVPVMPNYFVSQDPQLSRILEPLWTDPRMPVVERHGGSFWFTIAG
jgi:hypothetical protein